MQSWFAPSFGWSFLPEFSCSSFRKNLYKKGLLVSKLLCFNFYQFINVFLFSTYSYREEREEERERERE